jgi:hypothetical protein
MKLLLALIAALASTALGADPLILSREANWLVIGGPQLPGEIRINYLEAYCRAGSTDADWVKHTVIPHKSELVSATPQKVVIRDVLADGVAVDHVITATADEVDFQLAAKNPTSTASEVHWAQPCVRLSKFLGLDDATAGNTEDYLPKCFIFLDGKPTRMPTPQWETKARYIPGQTWAARGVPRSDVNPRPLNPLTPSNGLIGCFSADEKLIWATAWDPYQELFQGVARCLHSDPRIGGLAPGETKKIHGKIYIVPNDIPALLTRYQRDFPNQTAR